MEQLGSRKSHKLLGFGLVVILLCLVFFAYDARLALTESHVDSDGPTSSRVEREQPPEPNPPDPSEDLEGARARIVELEDKNELLLSELAELRKTVAADLPRREPRNHSNFPRPRKVRRHPRNGSSAFVTSTTLSEATLGPRSHEGPKIDNQLTSPAADVEYYFHNRTSMSNQTIAPIVGVEHQGVAIRHHLTTRVSRVHEALNSSRPVVPSKGNSDARRVEKFRDVVVLLTTGSYHRNCSSLPAAEPCPPDRLALIQSAIDPKRGWLRGTRSIVISNHPWPELGVRGIHEVNQPPLSGSKRRLREGQHILLPFRNDIMIAGVLMANDT